MISKIYTVNQSNETVAAPASGFAIIPFGNVIRRKGRSLMLNGGSLVGGPGYFEFQGDLEFVAEDAGTVSVQLFQDGAPIPGSLKTVTATAGETVHIPVIGMARLLGACCQEVQTTFTIGVNAGGTISNLAVVSTAIS